MIQASFEKVGKYFGPKLVFSDLSFQLEAGRRYGLLGPNGAGKSTLLRLLTGVLRPDEGEVSVGDLAPWRRQAEVRARLGVLPEGAPLLGELSPREHLRLAAGLRGLDSREFGREEERLVEGLRLGAFYLRPAGILSQGQKRRAALASALLGDPDFLVLDEPTSGLDPEESVRLLALLRARPAGSTLLVSSHLLGEVREMTDQVLVLAGGRLAAFGPWSGFGAQNNEAGEAALRREYLSLVERERPA